MSPLGDDLLNIELFLQLLHQLEHARHLNNPWCVFIHLHQLSGSIQHRQHGDQCLGEPRKEGRMGRWRRGGVWKKEEGERRKWREEGKMEKGRSAEEGGRRKEGGGSGGRREDGEGEECGRRRKEGVGWRRTEGKSEVCGR